MSFRRRAVLPFLALALGACASAGGVDVYTTYFSGELAPHRTVLDVSPERVAEVLPDAYELMGLPVEQSEDRPGLFLTPEMEIEGSLYEGERNSDYMDCGETAEGPRADGAAIRFALFTRLASHPDGGTAVETALGGFARDDATGEDVACHGTGKLESQIARVLRIRAPR